MKTESQNKAAAKKLKGYRLEVATVKALQDIGLEAIRAFASDGRRMGFPSDADVKFEFHGQRLYLQCKSGKELPARYKAPVGFDGIVNGQWLIIELRRFFDLLNGKRLVLLHVEKEFTVSKLYTPAEHIFGQVIRCVHEGVVVIRR
jgi:hypothetical protein